MPSSRHRHTPSPPRSSTPRAVWKGAIAFGLVHIPVSLYPATAASRLDFDLLDKRDFAAVGYQRINKRSGEPVASDNIVKGYEYEDDQYVVLSNEDFRRANVEAAQSVDIFAFAASAEIPIYHYETPYYLEPTAAGAKGYALLREVLRRKQRLALAKVVIRTRQYLAAVVPVQRMLLLNTLRFASEIRPLDVFDLPDDDLSALRVSAREVDMAEHLVDDMTEGWHPDAYRDSYRDDLLALIEHKVAAGETHVLTESATETGTGTGAEVVDLMALLKGSLDSRRAGRRKPVRAARTPKTSAAHPSRRKHT